MEKITVDLVPTIYTPATCHASQSDNGRRIGIELTENGQPYNLTGGELLTLKQKTGAGVELKKNVENPGGNIVIIVVTPDMCATAGVTLCEIEIKDNSKKIGTANFILWVEPLP